MRNNLRLVTELPATEMQKVGRKCDADYGRDAHKYLSPSQVEALTDAGAASGRPFRFTGTLLH
jgi:hypothetical protein